MITNTEKNVFDFSKELGVIIIASCRHSALFWYYHDLPPVSSDSGDKTQPAPAHEPTLSEVLAGEVAQHQVHQHLQASLVQAQEDVHPSVPVS